jgi:RNA polymerase sigma-70 factor, ECF subfamily
VTEKEPVTRAPAARSAGVDPDGEHEVVAGLRGGSPDAFDRAYDAWRARVYGFLVRMCGRRDLAEDLLQETFVRLATRARGLAEDTRLGPWLFTVARNLFVSHRRSAILDRDRLDQLTRIGAGRGLTPFDDLAGTEARGRLEAALAALPEAYREVILLVAVERMTPADAAAVLAIKADALRQRLSRARAMLEDALVEPAEPPDARQPRRQHERA